MKRRLIVLAAILVGTASCNVSTGPTATAIPTSEETLIAVPTTTFNPIPTRARRTVTPKAQAEALHAT